MAWSEPEPSGRSEEGRPAPHELLDDGFAPEPCELLVFDAEALSRYFETHPERGYVVLKDLFGVLNRRLRQADRRVGSLFAWGLKAHGIDRHL